MTLSSTPSASPTVRPDDRFRFLADAIPQLVWVTDGQGRELYCNARLQAYIDPAEVPPGALMWPRLLHPDDLDATRERWSAALLSREAYECQHRLRMRDGSFRWHVSRAVPALNAAGEVTAWFGTATDIDDTKRAELNAQCLAEVEACVRAALGSPQLERDVLAALCRRLAQTQWAEADPGRRALIADWQALTNDTDALASSVAAPGSKAWPWLSACDAVIAPWGTQHDKASVSPTQLWNAVDVEGVERWAPETPAAALFTPVCVDGVLMAVLAVGTTHGDRRWRADEVALIGDIANRLHRALQVARASESLRKSEARLRSVLAAARMGAWELDVDSGMMSGSERIGQLLGYYEPPATLSYATFLSHVHVQDRARIEACFVEAVRSKRPCQAECRVIGADGVERWISLAGSLLESTGRATKLGGLAQDITERRVSQIDATLLTDLAESIRRAESPDVLQADAAALVGAHLGVSRCFFAEVDEDADAWSIRADYVDTADQPTIPDRQPVSAHASVLLDDLRQGRTVVVDDTDNDWRTRDRETGLYTLLGTRAFVAIPLLRDGRWIGALAAFARDRRPWSARETALLEVVGERVWLAVEKLRLHEEVRERGRALQRSDGRYRTLFESMGQAFCIIEVIFDDSGGPVDYMFLETNPVFANHTGLADVVGKRARDVAPNLESKWFSLYGSVATTRQAVHFVEDATLDGERWFEVYAFPIEEPALNRVAIFFSDVTERRRAEAVLRDADRRKDEFLATLAHELRNPLAPLRTGIELLRMPAIPAPAVARTLQIMDRQLTQLVRLVDDLLDVSRITLDKLELRIERVHLQDVIGSAVEACRPLVDAAGHTLEVQVAETPIDLDADFTRLAQVCANLLNNAVRYTPPGGRVLLTAFADGNDVVVRVSDTGIGIDHALLSRVFDPFVQGAGAEAVQSGGLGVGLTLVRRLVELHHGTVSASSPGEGLGSQFDVRLPRRQGPPPEAHGKIVPVVHGAPH